MNPFDIQFSEKTLTIQPLLNNTFEISENGKRIATIQPVIIDNETRWTSKEVSLEDAQAIGNLIAANQ